MKSDIDELTELRKKLDNIRMSRLSNERPNSKCNGCQYEHPFADNYLEDDLNLQVLCKRNITPKFIRDGRHVSFEGHGLMICDKYKM